MMFIKCEKCGKNLIELLPNGMFRFLFGKASNGNVPVDITIQGNIKMKCIRRTCGNVQIINYLPFNLLENSNQGRPEPSDCSKNSRRIT